MKTSGIYAQQTPHPIIFMWSHPRSMSTAVERIMRERGDLLVQHEPFMHYYYRGLQQKEMPEFDYDKSHPVDVAEIFMMLKQQTGSAPVFAKDMSYYIVGHLQSMPALSHEAKHFFLIRDPRRSILSYHKLDKNILSEEVGIAAQWQHYQWLAKNLEQPPLVIEAEQVQQDPVTTMKLVWQKLGLEFIADAFDWQATELPPDWQQVAYWHQQVSGSQGIVRQAREPDRVIQQRFDEYTATYPELISLLSDHWPAYTKLRGIARRMIKAADDK